MPLRHCSTREGYRARFSFPLLYSRRAHVGSKRQDGRIGLGWILNMLAVLVVHKKQFDFRHTEIVWVFIIFFSSADIFRASLLVHEFSWRACRCDIHTYTCLGMYALWRFAQCEPKPQRSSKVRFVQSTNSIPFLLDCLASIWAEANLQTCISSYRIRL